MYTKISILLVSTALIAGCARNPFPGGSDPYVDTNGQSIIADANAINASLNLHRNWSIDDTYRRNQYITLKMWLIDKYYFDYERKLTNQDEELNSFGQIGSLATNVVGGVIPAGQATKILSATAAGLTGVTSLYDKQYLLSQTIQHLQTQMRTDRKNQAALIYTRMHTCGGSQYNEGLVLSDLEAYARYGTVESAIQNVQKTLTSAEDAAQTSKQVAASTASPKDTGTGAAAMSNTTAAADLSAAIKSLQTLQTKISGKCPLYEQASTSRSLETTHKL